MPSHAANFHIFSKDRLSPYWPGGSPSPDLKLSAFLASQNIGITGVSHRARPPDRFHLPKLKLPIKQDFPSLFPLVPATTILLSASMNLMTLGTSYR